MPSIIYGGVRYDQVRHAVYCKSCKDTVESTHIHDYKICSCGSVGVDGGIEEGNRIIGDRSLWYSRMLYRAVVRNKLLWLPEHAVEAHFNNIHPPY